ncbi:winged helix-turn-helix domain-containing tetratricopeptide repeat protein [soil metagenome]
MSSQSVNYEFEGYKLLTNERLLLYAGQSVALKPKVLETLLALVRNHGRVIEKADLMTQIWGDSFVEEGNLSQYVFILRKIFGEKPREHRFIVTIPGQGYSFVAKVREILETGKTYSSNNGHSANGHIKSLAVLPLKFLIPDEAGKKKYLGLAIADSLITQLNAGHAGSIYPTEAILKYVETEKDAVSVGRELEVDTVLSGSIQRSDGIVRASLQLHKVETGTVLWASKFEVQSSDFFELQDRISEQVTAALMLKLNESLSIQNTLKNPENYQSFIKYRFFWETRTESGLLTGLKGAKELVAAEPDFALGHIAVADSYLLLGHHVFLAPDQVLPTVSEAVDKALELDPGMAEAYATKADYTFVTRNWKQAETMYQQAIRLKPEYPSAHHWYGWFLMMMGHLDESLEQIEQAQRLDPSSLYLGMVRGVPLYYKGLFDQAIKQFRLILDIDPNYSRARYYLGSALFHSGEQAAGIAEFEKVVKAEPIQQTFGLLGYCYGAAGRHSEAREVLRHLDLIESKRYLTPYVRAWVHNGLRETDEALTQLERAFDEGAIWLAWVNIDLHFINLHEEPRFRRLIQKMNFPSL